MSVVWGIVRWWYGDLNALPCRVDKEGQHPRSVSLPAMSMGVMAMMVMMVSPVAMPVPKGSPYHHGRGAVHYWRRGHDYGRSRDDDRRRVYDRWRGSDHYWGGVHRDANANGDPDPCVCAGSAKVATARHARSAPIQSLRCLCCIVFSPVWSLQKHYCLLTRTYELGQIFPILLSWGNTDMD